MAVTITETEATKLFEEKIAALQESRNRADAESKAATERLDKALHEVTTLQQEKATLIEGNAKLQEDGERIKATLAEHRKNVEASLEQQETKAMDVIQRASESEAKAKADAQALAQRQEQLRGVKQALRADLASIVSAVTEVVQKTQAALDAIPE